MRGFVPETYTGFYKDTLLPLMRQHGVRRIFAMSTLSYPQPDDRFSLRRLLLMLLVRLVVNAGYRTAVGIAGVFAELDEQREAARQAPIEWTVYRIGGIPGGSDEASWKADRDDGESFEGWIGHKGWGTSQRRAALARWLVDAVEDGKEQWIGKMPAISRLAGSKGKTA